MAELQPFTPPEPEPDAQVTRTDWQYQTPKERLEVARDAIIGLSEISQALKFLDQSDPDSGENFPGAVEALNKIYDQLEEYKGKLEE